MKTSGTRRIAERYVSALFDVATSDKALDAVEKDLAVLAAALQESEEFQHFLTNPLLTRETQAEAMKAVLTKMKVAKTTQQFVAMLADHRRLSILGDIAKLFIERTAAARGEMTAQLIAAAPLKPKDVAEVGERLGKSFGKKVNVETQQDASLLGGVIVKIGSQQLDASLAGKLARLGMALRA